MNIVLHCQFDYIKLLISCQATVPPFSLFFRVLFTKNPASSLSLLGIQNRITPPSSSLASGTGFRGLDFYNFFVNNLFNFSPVRFSFPLFYRYLRWKSGLFLQPVCHFYQRCFSNFFPLFFEGMSWNFPLEGTVRKNFFFCPPLLQKKIGSAFFRSANLHDFLFLPGEFVHFCQRTGFSIRPITAPPWPHSPDLHRSAWPGWSWRSSPLPSTPDALRRW